MQQYVRLYIYSFGFQATLARANQANSMEDKDENAYNASIFNGRLLLSPDAKFIMQATEAAVDLLMICADSMHPKNVLQFLPWRFYLYIACVERLSFLDACASQLAHYRLILATPGMLPSSY